VTTLEKPKTPHRDSPDPGPSNWPSAASPRCRTGRGCHDAIYAARAGGGIIEDVDGNRLIDLGSGYFAVTDDRQTPHPG